MLKILGGTFDKMFKKITIIIPTYKRHKYLHRILDYYSDTNIKILVADSSSKRFFVNKKYKNVNYFHYKNRGYSEKIANIIKKVKTEYVVMCADDDFIVPKSIIKCLKFLEKYKDYSSAQGHQISFINKGSKMIYSPIYLQSIGMDINSKRSLERIRQQLSYYMQQFYSIHRTKTLKKSFEYANKINNFNLIELFISMIACINGKHKILPIFYSAREQIEGSAGHITAQLDVISSDKKYKKEYDYFVNSISRYLSQKEKITFPVAKEKVLESLEKNIKYLKKSKNRLNSVLKRKIYSVSPLIGRFIRGIYLKIIRKKEILSTKKIKGFPFYDNKAKKELKKIDYFIKKHNI